LGPQKKRLGGDNGTGNPQPLAHEVKKTVLEEIEKKGHEKKSHTEQMRVYIKGPPLDLWRVTHPLLTTCSLQQGPNKEKGMPEKKNTGGGGGDRQISFAGRNPT